MKFNTFTRKTELIKGRLQKVVDDCKAAAALLEKSNGSTLSRRYQEKMSTYGELITEKYREFETLLDKVTSEAEGEDDYVADTVTKFQDEISELYVSANSYIKSFLPSPPRESPVLENSNASDMERDEALSVVRLPRLELPTFRGDFSSWMVFFNVFSTTILENTKISDVQKFQYLITSLQGPALTVVSQLPLTAPNFKIAWELLCKRFHNKRRLASIHLNKIVDLPNVPKNSLNCLRQFLSSYHENVQALKALGYDLQSESPLLVTILLRKIDVTLRKKFEDSRTDHDLPATGDLINFLEEDCMSTEDSFFHFNRTQNTNSILQQPRPTATPYPRDKMALFVDAKIGCNFCSNSSHKIYQCNEFQSKSPQERLSVVQSNRWCTNCLGSSHLSSACDSKHRCKICSMKHHTMVHLGNKTQTTSQSKPYFKNTYTNKTIPGAPPQPNTKQILTQSQDDKSSVQAVVALSRQADKPDYRVLLGTALVKVKHNGISHVLRGCLDSAAMASFLSQHAAQLLGVKRSYTPKYIQGISATPVKTLGVTDIIVSSLNEEFTSAPMQTLILEKITSNLPDTQISEEVKQKMKAFVLADPTFDLPSPIDILIGADLFPQLMTGDNFSLGQNLPTAVGTVLGYVLMGKAPILSAQESNLPTHLTLLFTQDVQLNETLLKFWQSEEPPTHQVLSDEDKLCEEFFTNTYSRDESGRFIVRLPKRQDINLGESANVAKRQFFSLEKRLCSQPNMKHLYENFMDDYLGSKHMQKYIPPNNEDHFYLPHHGVLKANSTTTKLRVVFNASQKTSNGYSLNDKLLPGPKLQNDICDVILNFRHKSIVFLCDIKQMYRQIQVHEDDYPYQLIYWRNNPSLPLETYALKTVTYGMSCSPYLAIRTLQQLVKEEGHHFPRAAKLLQSQIYMDDCLGSASSAEEATNLMDELTQLLLKGGFSLRKWVSNEPLLLNTLPKDHIETPLKFTNLEQPLFNVLGLFWSPECDCFSYKIDLISHNKCSKRTVISTLARLYDPCGFLSPVLFWAKSFIQLLWTQGLNWDDQLSPELSWKWNSYLHELPKLEEISICRHLFTDSAINVQLHGFSDASELGYAANVYVRCVNSKGDVRINLLFAKSRVAPLKKISLPRLELNGAHLLAKILHYCQKTLSNHLKINSIQAWSDSTVTLAWIHTPPYRLKTYIANRVAQIQELVPPNSWNHVKSADNPADCCSRGLLPSQLQSHHLWWTGPKWLCLQSPEWPTLKKNDLDLTNVPELKPPISNVLVTTDIVSTNSIQDLLHKFSTWSRLQYVMARVLRFIHNCRNNVRITGEISHSELRKSNNTICRLVQENEFSIDFTNLKKDKICSSRLRSLNPFIDQDNLIRVGGRLRHSHLNEDAKHPVLLPKNHHVTSLIIDHFHVKNLHCGPQLLQSLLHQQYWILSARSIIRKRVFRCHRCFRFKPTNKPPLMGDLPESRITPSRPFSKTGVDFAGPILIKTHLLRRTQNIKAYLCLFVCFATKAVHIEVVTNMTSDAFIAALSRFTSRRGLCSDLYSDCGTNLVGASNKLKKLTQDFFNQEDTQLSIKRFSAQYCTNFHFNPPAAPHQGGLWESAIKSAKYHLHRVIGDYTLTLEELITLTVKVEAILNSRPLTALSADPSEPSALTPGHFLIGAPLVSLPEAKLEDIPINRLKRWQIVQAFTQRLWKRWSVEYLHSLQQRTKWTFKTPSLQTGDIVIVHEPDTPPLQWTIGKINSTFPGADSVVRVVEVKTPRGLLRRPVTKVFKLPQ